MSTTFKQDEPLIKRIRAFESKIYELQAENKALKEHIKHKTNFRLEYLEKMEKLQQSRDKLLDVAYACMLHSDNSDISRKNIQSRIDAAETLKD